VIANGVEGDIPTLDGVTAFTICAELAAMDVGVAICAVLADIFEDEAGMALSAAYFLMHTAQGISCLVVIEFRI
jgi:hypothetical protein